MSVILTILAFIPLIGVGSIAIVEAIKAGIPSEGSVFTIQGQGPQAWIVIDGERRIIDTTALELLGFDIGTTRIGIVEIEKAEKLPIGLPVTVELIHAMRISI